MSGPLRLGLAGFGRLARDYYVPALRTIPDARVVAVADPLSESRAAASERLSSPEVYSDSAAMLERSRLDAVLVASPPSTHLPIWRDAARRGLAVFLEKPVVLSSQISEIERVNPLPRLMLDFNRRFWPTYQRVGGLLRSGALGNPVEVDFRLHTDVLSWSTVTRHRLAPEEGGILHDLGGHPARGKGQRVRPDRPRVRGRVGLPKRPRLRRTDPRAHFDRGSPGAASPRGPEHGDPRLAKRARPPRFMVRGRRGLRIPRPPPEPEYVALLDPTGSLFVRRGAA